ncbi:MAG: 30S ribosome-binding factor RbfA [Chlamydiales bacterium]|nr:30S ribosome-binding factor RbfA [Chlamydiales bacterium]
MAKKRIERLNSLLKEVLSEVIREDVRDPRLSPLVSVTRVDITNDLQHAKVYISVIGTKLQKESTIQALQSAAGFVALTASKKVVMRYFPALNFKLDQALEEQLRIEEVLGEIHKEQKSRKEPPAEQEP